MSKKKNFRKLFRKSVFVRDKFTCLLCGLVDEKAHEQHVNNVDFDYQSELLDAHHVTPREDMPNGGYVKENGITVCKNRCHLAVENYLAGHNINPSNSPYILYTKIGSSKDRAIEASKRLI
jgi:hypothetical protein